MPPDTGSLFSFFAGAPASSALSYPAMEARRRIALQMLANSGRKGYPKTFGEGLTAIGDAIGDIGAMRGLSAQEAAFQKQAAADAEGGIPTEARTPAAPGPQASTSTETDAAKPTAYAPTDDTTTEPVRTAAPVAAATPPPTEVEPGVVASGYNPLDAAAGTDPWLAHRKALAAIETGGEKDPYTALGKVIPKTGDRAYGMYQIMGANIPSWTQAATGQALTPQQFLASPAAQEATAKHRFTGYVNKYGDEGAARAWYAGEHGMDKLDHTDVHERLSVRDYGRDFMNRMAPYNRDRVAAAVTPPDAEQSSAALPLTAPDTAPPGLPPEITQGFSATPQAQARIRTAPPLQMAQATPQPAQAAPAREAVPVLTPMSDNEKRGYQIRARERAMGIPVEMQQGQGLIDLGVRDRQQRDAVLMQDYRDRLQMAHQRQLAQEAFEQGAPQRELEMAKARQGLIQPPAAVAVPAGTQMAGPGVPAGGDPRLGTPQSPQRTGVPTAPPIPSGITPEQHAAQQAPILTRAAQAEQQATPEFQRSMALVQALRDHPGREWGLGSTGKIAGQIPGTQAFDFHQRLSQLQGKEFLQAYQTLKGGGSITEIEGTKATQALARLNAAQGPKEFDNALNDLEKTMRSDLELAQRKVNKPVTAWQSTPNSPYAPDIGQQGLRKGKLQEYLGGNPASDESYREIR